MNKQQVTIKKPWTNGATAYAVGTQPTVQVYDPETVKGKDGFAPDDTQITQATYDALVRDRTIEPVAAAAPAPAPKAK
jgi:hypothetical protein